MATVQEQFQELIDTALTEKTFTLEIVDKIKTLKNEMNICNDVTEEKTVTEVEQDRHD